MADAVIKPKGPKSGFLTSEFWVTVINSVVGVLVILGYLTPVQADEVTKAAAEVMAGLMVLVSTAAYIYSRIVVKRDHAMFSSQTPPLPMKGDAVGIQTGEKVVVD